ncbi:MAG: hypothetical protein U1U88_002046 [Lawsonella clevelandensis]
METDPHHLEEIHTRQHVHRRHVEVAIDLIKRGTRNVNNRHQLALRRPQMCC